MLLLSAASVFFVSVTYTGEKQPNVVLTLADNVGWADVGVYGGGEVRGKGTLMALSRRIDGLETWQGRSARYL